MEGMCGIGEREKERKVKRWKERKKGRKKERKKEIEYTKTNHEIDR